MKIVFILTLVGLTLAMPRKKYSLGVAQTGATVDVAENSSDTIGKCTCDITMNSCDAYCCCDTDCTEPIRSFWNLNYQDYCAKNEIGAAYKPKERCIDSSYIFNTNQRLGMKIDETDGRICVEIDSATAFSDFSNYVDVNTISWPTPRYPIEDTMFKPSKAE